MSHMFLVFQDAIHTIVVEIVPNDALRSWNGDLPSYRSTVFDERVAYAAEPNHLLVLRDSQPHVAQFGKDFNHLGRSFVCVHRRVFKFGCCLCKTTDLFKLRFSRL